MGIYGIPDPSVKVSAPAAASLNLSGKRMVVVGGTSGIGRAIALLSAARGAAVTVVGRSFKDQGVANLTFIQKDLSLMTHAAELGRSLPPADVVVLTQGILPPKTREATPEGLEKDMAVSTLSRLVTLRELLPRLQPSSRVFVWGMPGNGAVPKTTRIDDLNSEKGYAGGFGWTHINTVAGNEAMVVHLAEIEKAKGPGKGVSIFGMNPGLVKTDIRGGTASCSGWLMESMMQLFNPTLDQYAATITPLLFAPGLEEHNGAMFGQKGTAILPNTEFLGPNGKARAKAWFDAMEKLLADKGVAPGPAPSGGRI